MEKTYFLGSNTGDGFIGTYEHILRGQVIILKGGAGTGKSTLMKKISAIAKDGGHDVEVYKCSSDVESLDAVYIPSLSAAVIDGTAPHVTEAEFPAVTHFVFNLLDKADYKKLLPYETTIKNCVSYKKQYFTNAYAYLNCAKVINSNFDNYVAGYVDQDKINAFAADVFAELPKSSGDVYGNRFGRAITDKGIINTYSDNFLPTETIAIKSEFEIQSTMLLLRLKSLLDTADISYQQFISPTRYPQCEGIFTCGRLITFADFTAGNTIIDLETTVKPFNRRLIKIDTELSDELTNRAVESINFAHLTHMEIEKLYSAAQDWKYVNDKTAEIIDLIFNY